MKKAKQELCFYVTIRDERSSCSDWLKLDAGLTERQDNEFSRSNIGYDLRITGQGNQNTPRTVGEWPDGAGKIYAVKVELDVKTGGYDCNWAAAMIAGRKIQAAELDRSNGEDFPGLLAKVAKVLGVKWIVLRKDPARPYNGGVVNVTKLAWSTDMKERYEFLEITEGCLKVAEAIADWKIVNQPTTKGNDQ